MSPIIQSSSCLLDTQIFLVVFCLYESAYSAWTIASMTVHYSKGLQIPLVSDTSLLGGLVSVPFWKTT